jgi:hypothetical protein
MGPQNEFQACCDGTTEESGEDVRICAFSLNKYEKGVDKGRTEGGREGRKEKSDFRTAPVSIGGTGDTFMVRGAFFTRLAGLASVPPIVTFFTRPADLVLMSLKTGVVCFSP